MATARRLHNLEATENVTITSNGTISNAQGFLWAANLTNIEWTNNTSSAVRIEFTIGGLPDIPISGNGGIGGPISGSNSAVNYQINDANGNKISGPYCVQWAQGALQVSVTTSSGPFTVAVPASASLAQTGNLQFISDEEYKVAWANENGGSATPWSNQPTKIYPPSGGVNPNPVQPAVVGAPTPVTCTFTLANNVPGKVTVLIGSSN